MKILAPWIALCGSVATESAAHHRRLVYSRAAVSMATRVTGPILCTVLILIIP